MIASAHAFRLLASVMLAWSSLSAVAAEAVKKPVFAWPVPMRFQVEERLNKGGNIGTFRHTFSFTKAKDEYRLAWEDAECLEMNGQKINTPELKKQMRGAELMWVSNPPLRISSDGVFLGCEITPEVIVRMNDSIDLAVPGRSQETKKKLADMLATPAGQQVYTSLLGQYWNSWVQQWLETPTVSGGKATNEVMIAMVQTYKAKGETIFTNHGQVTAERKSIVKVSAEEIVGGSEYAASVTKAFNELAAQQGHTNDMVLVSARRETQYEAETDLSSMRPAFASRKVRTKMEIKGEKPNENVQEYEYRFFWPDSATEKNSNP